MRILESFFKKVSSSVRLHFSNQSFETELISDPSEVDLNPEPL